MGPAEKMDFSKLEIAREVSLAPHTTMRAGGTARHFAVAENEAGLKGLLAFAKEKGEPFFLLGAGSNVIFSDEEFPGLVILLGKGFREARIDEASGEAVAGGAVPLPLLGRMGVERGWRDFIFLCPIPGTVGAGVAMNAGAGGFDISSIFRWADVMDAKGEVRRVNLEGAGFSYRSSAFKTKGEIILRAAFKTSLEPIDPAVAREILMAEVERRIAAQPRIKRNCGSIFKNPHGGPPAGKLIEEAGLKGREIGGARIAHEHANWIVNTGAATGGDLRELMALAQSEVKRLFGIDLEREVVLMPEDIGSP